MALLNEKGLSQNTCDVIKGMTFMLRHLWTSSSGDIFVFEKKTKKSSFSKIKQFFCETLQKLSKLIDDLKRWHLMSIDTLSKKRSLKFSYKLFQQLLATLLTITLFKLTHLYSGLVSILEEHWFKSYLIQTYLSTHYVTNN